ncbi:hypothetical protein Pint_05275 [Pistacia integerrima]|uniref:Uncharacterized protein n=1 Tax=Pistacia integerrima TaxID=434235 RepID=A0ACC0Z406_9ROSI|nr:hypothetical protein Pint_05275 [Pistacia integerrima]
MGVIKAAIGDAVFTAMWVFCSALRGILTRIISTSFGLQDFFPVKLFISTTLATIFIITFIFIGKLLGGASFNPSTSLSSYTAGLKSDSSLISVAVRFPAQAAGGIAGIKAILQMMPAEYKGMLKGPFLKVDLHSGAIAEGVLTFLFCLSLLVIMQKGPRNLILQVWLFSLSTAGLVLAGSGYTGPSMNPANAFGWAYINNKHNTWEMFYVYWICPFIGAILAAWFFQFLFPAKTNKQKKA